MTSIRVLICDDQDMIRQGLKTILDRQDDMSVVGLAADGLQAVQMAHDLKPDVVLMDIKMPNLDGIGATRRITQENAAIHVIILTTYDADDMVFDGIRAGAQGYLLKDAGSEAILTAIRGAANGESQLDPQIAWFGRELSSTTIRFVITHDPAWNTALIERGMLVPGFALRGSGDEPLASFSSAGSRN